jgi:ketosteroid isomerase-like protein
MSEHPNAIRIRELAAAFQRGDLAAVVDAYADDSVYRVPGDNLVAGNYQKHELGDFFAKLGEMTGGTFKIEVDDVLGDDDHAVMFWSLTADRNGRHLDTDGGMAFKINPDGKIAESWFLYSDQREYDAFYR